MNFNLLKEGNTSRSTAPCSNDLDWTDIGVYEDVTFYSMIPGDNFKYFCFGKLQLQQSTGTSQPNISRMLLRCLGNKVYINIRICQGMPFVLKIMDCNELAKIVFKGFNFFDSGPKTFAMKLKLIEAEQLNSKLQDILS